MTVDPVPLLRYRCDGCGYGASCRQMPARCPMCGGGTWREDRRDPGRQRYADLAADLVSAARRAATRAGADADAPLVREAGELSVFPGVPLS